MKLKKTQTSRKELPKTFLDSYFFSYKERGETTMIFDTMKIWLRVR